MSAEPEDDAWILYSHYPTHGVECWDVMIGASKDEAIKAARHILLTHPVTPCGTGGVSWMELFGPGVEESLGVEWQGDDIIVTGQ